MTIRKHAEEVLRRSFHVDGDGRIMPSAASDSVRIRRRRMAELAGLYGIAHVGSDLEWRVFVEDLQEKLGQMLELPVYGEKVEDVAQAIHTIFPVWPDGTSGDDDAAGPVPVGPSHPPAVPAPEKMPTWFQEVFTVSK
jgi:hypothetical protein